ncbi:MAG: hypothetical protein IJS41_08975, partial [Clostridia bacterium]|nr:hypothetical protein [Clostridia bacterium]
MRKVSRGLIGYIAMIAVFIFLIVLLSGGVNTVDRRIEYPQLLKLIDQGKVDRVSIRNINLVGRYKDSSVSLSDYPSRAYDFETTIGPDFYDTVLTMAANKKGVSVDTVSVNDLKNILGFEIEYLAPVTTPWYLEMLPYLIPIVLLMVMWWYIMRQQTGGGGRVMNFGKSRAAMVDPSKNKITFADVAGADEEKEELREIVDFLKNPKHYA